MNQKFQPIARLRHFNETSRHYFHHCQDEIAQSNLLMLHRFSIITTMLIAAHIISVAFIVRKPWVILTLMGLLLCSGVLTWQVLRCDSAQHKDNRRIDLLCTFQELLVMVYIVFISVFTMPDRVAIYYPAAFMFLPMLFTRPVWRTLASLTSVTVVYVTMLVLFKPALAMSDGAVAMICLLMGAVMSFLVYDLRLREFAVRTQLQALGAMDGLTGLNNKASTERLCAAYLTEHALTEDCALLMIDVDDFKQVNDRAGHQAGDMVLAFMGDTLRSLFRGNDVLGRIGGDEFLVLVKGTCDRTLLMDRASQLEQHMGFCDPGYGLSISCTVGISMHRAGEAITYDALFAMADRTMYEAKNAGKNRIAIHDPAEDHTAVMRRVMVVADDDPIGRALICNIFEKDYDIVEAADGQETLDKMALYGPRAAVLLLDIGMPVLDGYAVMHQLANSKRLKDIPVIVITADSENELRALEMGATDMIHKPIDPQILQHRVSNALRRAR